MFEVPLSFSLLDHATAPVPDTLQLDMNNTLKCVTINITNDNEVEGTEVFMVHFTETDDNRIMIDGTDTVPVYIEDDEGTVDKLTEKLWFCSTIYSYVRILSREYNTELTVPLILVDKLTLKSLDCSSI